MDKAKSQVESAAKNKYFDFFTGLNNYYTSSVNSWVPKARTIWEEGTTRILDYGGAKNAKPIMFIPPLINRANILDMEGSSLMEYLKSVGFRPLLVDWQQPSDQEIDFTSDDYVKRLAKFSRNYNRQMIIGGYCMGGMLAMKLAGKVNPEALVLLATPWNFHAPDVRRVNVPKTFMEKYLNHYQFVPPEVIQSLFMISDPWHVYNKYAEFGANIMKGKSIFSEIERWVNDGVMMSTKLAKEAIIGWSLENTPGMGKWFDPSALKMPTFLGCTTRDNIVPIGCSVPLAGLIPNADLFKFDGGHISMLTKKLCFEPMANWLKKTT